MAMSAPGDRIIAVGLLSGGLDSTLAARVLLDQGIDVRALNFVSPFCCCTPRGNSCAAVVRSVVQLGNIPLQRISLGQEYLQMVRQPRHGYGRGMNPCLDCRIIKLRKAHEYMKKIGAHFLFTGEVLGQRPMSQHLRALELIDRECGLTGLVLRPLSASLLKPTEPELLGWVERGKLLAISGRSRKKQIRLAAEKNIADYPCPAGGCLLTDRRFAGKLREWLQNGYGLTVRDAELLKIGRNLFFTNGDRLIIARNQDECSKLEKLACADDFLFIPENFSGPSVLFSGKEPEATLKEIRSFAKKTPLSGALVRCFHSGLDSLAFLPEVGPGEKPLAKGLRVGVPAGNSAGDNANR
jgi:tRNA-specific 2-thiouridylase